MTATLLGTALAAAGGILVAMEERAHRRERRRRVDAYAAAQRAVARARTIRPPIPEADE